MDIMTSKTLAIISGLSCVAVLATYAWAANQEVKEVKVEEAPAALVEEVAATTEEAAEPARLCIPMDEATEAAAPAAEGTTEEAKTEESADTVPAEDLAAEAGLPICDEEGNPPAPEGEAAESEAAPAESTEAAEEPATEEPAKTE